MTSSAPPGKAPIFLLKTKSIPYDNYEEYFTKAGRYDPTFIPVLEHRYNDDNLRIVRDLFLSGSLGGDEDNRSRRKYGGLIFTSQRAVEGFARLLEDEVPLPASTSASESLVVYSVGPATSAALDTLRDSRLPRAEVVGHDCGTGEKLASEILEHYNAIYHSSGQDVRGKKLPLLFLPGKIHGDIIPRTVMSNTLPPERRISIDELIVYETGVMQSFEAEFSTSVKKAIVDMNVNDATAVDQQQKGKMMWVVVFSPTGCDAMLRVLNTLLPMAQPEDEAKRRNTKRYCIATIGPTTRDYLISKHGVEPDVCAEIPSPEGVGEAIEAFVNREKVDSTVI